MLERAIGKQHIKMNMWIFIALFIAMLMSPYTGNIVAKILVLSVIVMAFVNAIAIVYKVIKYYDKKRKKDISY